MNRSSQANVRLPRDKFWLLTGLLFAVGIITLAYGFAYKVSGTTRFTYFEVWSWVFVLCLVILVRGLMLSRTGAATSLELPDWVTPLVTTATLLSSFYFWLPSQMAIQVGIVVVAACVALYWWRSSRACIAFLLIAGFVLCCYLVITIPIDRNQSDMLPLMADADHFLLAGLDPYAQSYSNLFVYLPVLWLTYLPTVAAGVDMRLVSLASFAVVGLLIMWLVGRGRLNQLAFLGVCPIILSRSAVEMLIRAEVWPVWALLVVLAATLLSPGLVWPAVLLGVLLATQQPAALIAVLLGVWLLFHRGLAPTFRLTLIAAVVYAAILLPWVVLHPTLLFDLYIGVQKTFTQSHAIDKSWDALEVSLLNLLQCFELKSIRPILQAATIAAGIIYLAVFRNIRVGRFLCILGVVYLVAISLNVLVFKHYYFPGLLLLAIGIAVPDDLAGIGATQLPSRSDPEV